MSIKVGKSFKALIAAGAALVMAASMAACGPSAGTPSEAKSSDTGTSSSANAKARSLDEIKKSGKIKILGEQAVKDWLPSNALSIAENVLTKHQDKIGGFLGPAA